LLKTGAGDKFGVSGNYLYRTFMSSQFNGGTRCIFRLLTVGVTKRFECVNRTPTAATHATAIP